MAKSAKTEHELLEEATGWMLRLETEPQGSLLFQEFEVWLAASEDNRRAWENVNETWQLLGAVKPAYDQQVWGDVPPPTQQPPAPIPIPPARPLEARSSYRRPAVITAAALAAAWLLWIIVPVAWLALQADFRTATGQIQRVHMGDGSTVDLGGRSAIATNIGNTQRRVSLLTGEAYFDVASDSSRPFLVNVEGLEVKVIGTAFDVQVTSQTTTVALVRGSIEAVPEKGDKRPMLLKPGEMLTVDHATRAITLATVSLDDIGAWRDGKIFLTNTTVSNAVELIQRYHPAWISIPDRGLANRKVSGLFDLRDPDRALAALVEPFGGKVRSVTSLARVISRL